MTDEREVTGLALLVAIVVDLVAIAIGGSFIIAVALTLLWLLALAA